MSGRQCLRGASHLLIAMSIAAVAGCGPTAGPSARDSAVRQTADAALPDVNHSGMSEAPRSLRALDGIHCRPPSNGVHNCETDKFDISGSDTVCGAGDSNFGSVLLDHGANLLEGIGRGSPVAHLSLNQFVCIQYVAESKVGDEGWSYVTAIPASLVAECRARRCPEAAPVRWLRAQQSERCAEQPGRGYAAGCASGWVRSAALDAYSMEFSGRPAEPN